jgi:light-harvesting complex I chlorophyll a/b binding protein 1
MIAMLPISFNPLHNSLLPGNVNFDPLSLSSKDLTFKRSDPPREAQEILNDYREAELKHGRLAMLAAVAYPAQEVVNPLLSETLDLPNELALSTLSPSLVNGGLGASTVIAFLGLASGLELRKLQGNSKIPGDYGWNTTPHDPSSNEFYGLQAGEIWNSRIAMIAVLGYVVQEAVTQSPVLGVL